MLTAGISLNEFEFPPCSGVNVASDNGGPISIFFDSPVLAVAGYFTYAVPLTLTAFDAGNNQVGQAFSLFASNLALSGDAGSSPNESLSISFSGGISSVTITGDPAGGSFTLEDAAYTSTVPEPSSILLFLTAAGVLAARKSLYDKTESFDRGSRGSLPDLRSPIDILRRRQLGPVSWRL